MSRDCYLVYHDKCMDGLLGGGILFNKIPGLGLLPQIYPSQIDVVKHHNEDIIIVDYVVPANVIMTLLAQGCRVICLDHHAASWDHWIDVVENIPVKAHLINFFVMASRKMSGAALAEGYAQYTSDIVNNIAAPVAAIYANDEFFFHGMSPYPMLAIKDDFNDQCEIPEPEHLMNYLSNSDTYTYPHFLEESRHIRLGLEYVHSIEPEQSFITYFHLYYRYKNDWSELERIGKEIEEEQFVQFDAIIDGSARYQIGHTVDAQTTVMGEFIILYCAHEIANSLAQRYFSLFPKAFFMISARDENTTPASLGISLRGNNGVNPFNLSDIAKQINGGGHVNAAGGRMVVTHAEYEDLLTWDQIFQDANIPFSGTVAITV